MDSVKQQVSAKSASKQGNYVPFFQPKLTVNQPNDIYEQQADAMADRIMNEPVAMVNKTAFFKPVPNLVQKDDSSTPGKTLSGGLSVVKDKLGDKPGVEEFEDKETEALKKKLWDDQPTELKAAIIGSALSSLGILGAAFAGNANFRENTINTLNDTNILMPTALLPYHDYYGISSLKYKLPAAKNAPLTFDAEFEYKPLMDFLHKNVSYFPKTDLTLGVSSAYSAQKGFNVTGGSIKLKLGGGIVNLEGYIHQPLPPAPMLVSGTDPGESPMWMMRSLPSQADDKLATGSGVFVTIDVLRLPELWHKNDKPGVGIQRKCAGCEKEEKISRKETDDETPEVSSSVEQALQSGGEQLDKGTRGFMEQQFGYDFGNVKVHNDAQAHQSSASINALAYTHKDHIVFGDGQYSPQTDTGKRLLAHELTHVVQQADNISANVSQVQGDAIQRDNNTNTPAPASGVNIPSPPPPPAEQALINNANYQRLKNLGFALLSLDNINMALNDPAYDKSKLSTDFAPDVSALAKWLKINPADADFKKNLMTAMSLIKKNIDLSTTPPAFYQTLTGPKDAKGAVLCSTRAYAWSYVGDPSTGVSCCDDFIKSGPLCKADVITHEHFHLVGLGHGDRAGKGTARAERTTAECLDSSDNMAQLVSELNGITTDNCPGR